MNWDVNQIYGFLKWLILKNQAGGVSPTDFFYAWNAEQYSFQDDLLGKWENRANGKTGINTGLILNETIMQKLAPFTLPATLTISSGAVTKPEGFMYELGLRMNATDGTAGSRIVKIAHSKVYAINGSVIDAPSISNNLYYATEYEDYYSLLPSTVTGTVSLDYISKCTDVKWGYIFDIDGRQVYSQGLSVQPAWDQNSIVEITKRTLKSLGVHFKDGDFAQFGQSVIQTGE